MQNYFELFNLPRSFSIDLHQLHANFRKLQAEVHPDKFVTASPAERRQSMQMATYANEAYQTLKHPTERAKYLLQLHGVDVEENNNTAMPGAFLMAQMDWREAMEEAKQQADIDALSRLLAEVRAYSQGLQVELAAQLETAPHEAAVSVRKLRFIDKISDDVDQLIAHLEDAA